MKLVKAGDGNHELPESWHSRGSELGRGAGNMPRVPLTRAEP